MSLFLGVTTFYNNGDHFHKLPKNVNNVLKQWLAAMKRVNPPMGRCARVCIAHFTESDYVCMFKFDDYGATALIEIKPTKTRSCSVCI